MGLVLSVNETWFTIDAVQLDVFSILLANIFLMIFTLVQSFYEEFSVQ